MASNGVWIMRDILAQRLRRQRDRTSGFTLIELLIAIIISGIIVLGLLSLVIELVSVNRRELARTETQRDMGIALEYMSSELREAVYVYTGTCLGAGFGEEGQPNYCAGLFDGTGGLTAPDNSVPLIAFWKLDYLPEGCSNEVCEAYRVAGRAYKLVVYFLSTDNPDGIWEGPARLTRAELGIESDGTLSDGYVDPEGQFRSWASDDGTTLQADVLVDFVDLTPDPGGTDDDSYCPKEPIRYDITPSLGALAGEFDRVRSAYACVRDDSQVANTLDDDAPDSTGSFNQKVVLFLRGNPGGRYGLDKRACSSVAEGGTLDADQLRSEDNPCNLPTLKTEVLNRGVVNKKPRDL